MNIESTCLKHDTLPQRALIHAFYEHKSRSKVALFKKLLGKSFERSVMTNRFSSLLWNRVIRYSDFQHHYFGQMSLSDDIFPSISFHVAPSIFFHMTSKNLVQKECHKWFKIEQFSKVCQVLRQKGEGKGFAYVISLFFVMDHSEAVSVFNPILEKEKDSTCFVKFLL